MHRREKYFIFGKSQEAPNLVNKAHGPILRFVVNKRSKYDERLDEICFLCQNFRHHLRRHFSHC